MKCLICKNEMTLSNFFYYCEKCHFIKKAKIVDSVAEQKRYLQHNYDEKYDKYMFNLYNKIIIDKNINILDYGCGRIPTLSKVFNDYNIYNYDYYFYPFEFTTLSYDLIILNEVIEHIEDPLVTISSLVKLLHKNGKIVIHTGLTDNINDIEKWWYVRDITHISFFHTETFKYIARIYNLSYEYQEPFIILSLI